MIETHTIGGERAEKALREFIAATRVNADEEFQEAVVDLLKFTPEFTNREVFSDKNPMYDEGDEEAPFFSEAYLYTLLGKEDARTILALMRPIWALAGIQRVKQP